MEKPKFKIVFTDFDGVIVTARAGISLRIPPVLIPPRQNIDPIAVGLLNELCARTGAKIVISSSWRSRKSLRDSLTSMGFMDQHLYHGPNDDELWRIPFVGGVQRGVEIDQWLAEASKHIEVEKYVLVDDDRDFLDHQLPFLVQCKSSADGFSFYNFATAEDLLMGNDPARRYFNEYELDWGIKNPT